MEPWVLSSGVVTALITILAIFVSGIGFYWKQVYDSKFFKQEITDIKAYLKTLNDVVLRLALQTERLDGQGIRIGRLENVIDELRHGKGFVKDVN